MLTGIERVLDTAWGALFTLLVGQRGAVHSVPNATSCLLRYEQEMSYVRCLGVLSLADASSEEEGGDEQGKEEGAQWLNPKYQGDKGGSATQAMGPLGGAAGVSYQLDVLEAAREVARQTAREATAASGVLLSGISNGTEAALDKMKLEVLLIC